MEAEGLTQIEFSKRIRARSVSERIKAIRELTSSPHVDAEERLALLDRCLDDPSNLVVQAALRGLKRVTELMAPNRSFIPRLVETYWRVAEDGKRKDPGCIA